MATTSRVTELVRQGNRLFEQRKAAGLDALWQSQAEHFYPMRADFTSTRNAGEEFASHLMTGQPVLAHRDLGNALSAMLRPRDKPWFKARTDSEAINESVTPRTWLDRQSDRMRRIMYHKDSQFVRSTKQGDNDFVAFGQTVISVEPNRNRNGILYRARHIRDAVWCENAELQIDTIHVNLKLAACQMVKLFGDKCHRSVKEAAEKDPYKEIKYRHIVLPADAYDLTHKPKGSRKFPYVSLYVDTENDTLLEELPRRRFGYVIPRWVTCSGTQYAHSPATMIALPDARMLQMINLTLLEAGQKAVDPPLKVTAEAVHGGVNWYAGGVTTVDVDYDERLGKAIEPLLEPSPGLGWGDKREEKIERLIREAFFLDVIGLPPTMPGDKMTKYETQVRFEEYLRRALPLFEPMEIDYNGGLCEETFNLAMDLGAFGTMEDMPRELRGQDIRWQFESPLQAATERAKSEAFLQAAQLLEVAAQIDPMTKHDFDCATAFRDAMIGTGAPPKWVPDKERANKAKEAEAQQQQAMQMAQAAATAAAVAQQVGDAGQSLKAAGIEAA